MFRFSLSPIALAMLALSQAAHSSEKGTLLDEVVVSGSREGTAVRETPAAIHKLSGETVAQKKATFVGQLLNQAPGVYVSDLGNEQHSMSIRQPITTNAFYLYMEDGLPIRPVGLFNHNALYEINLMGIGNIEVIKGPSSSLYGGNAVGGAVNFFTRAPSLKPEYFGGFQLSDQGYRRLEAGASQTFGSQGYRLSAYASERDGGWQQHNDANKQGLTLRHDLEVASNAVLKTILSYNRLYTEMPGSLFKADYEERPGFSYNTFTWRKVEATRLSSSLEGAWNAGGLTTLTLYARDNTTDQIPSYLIFRTGTTTSSGRTSDQHSTSLGFDARHRQDLSGQTLRLITGVTGEFTPMKAQEVNLSIIRDAASGRYTSFTRGSTRRDYAVDISSQALYSQLEYSAIETVRLVAGVRADHIGYDYTNHLVPSSTTGAPSEQRSYSRASPKLGATWDVSPRVNLYTNYSQGFTPPEVSSQYGGSLVAPNLKPSVFDNVDAGVRWVGPNRAWAADIGVYQLRGKDEIVSYSITPGQSQPRNAGKTRHEGIEFGLSLSPTGRWDAKLNGAWARHTFDQYQTSPTENFNGKEIPAAPRWLINTEVGFKPAENTRVSAEAQHVGSYYMDNANTVKYPGHVLLNLRAETKAGAWLFWASIMNLTDKHYAEVASSTYKGTGAYLPNTQDTYTPGAPRTLMIGARYQFGGR
jgi:iron complex outermembrane receptor protein